MVITVTEQDENGKTLEQKRYDKMSQVSDGYHSFADLYHYRMLYNALFVNELYADLKRRLDRKGIVQSQVDSWDIHKSWRHSDGELCFGKENYFVVVVQLPTGQITNHYKGENWDLFDIPVRNMASEWDGHTPDQAVERMEAYLQGKR